MSCKSIWKYAAMAVVVRQYGVQYISRKVGSCSPPVPPAPRIICMDPLLVLIVVKPGVTGAQ